MWNRNSSIVIAVLFLIAVSLPAGQMCCSTLCCGGAKNPGNPPEQLRDAPASFLERMQRFENSFNEEFGLRNFLIRWNNIARIELLSITPIPHVILGKDGWLFYRSEAVDDGNTILDYRGLSPLSREALETIRQNLEADRDALAKRGIPYIVVIAPNKNTLYGEYLPDHMTKVGPATRLDQLMDYMEAHSGVELLDLREPLARAKREHPVYYSTDSHWNDYGAYIGYTEIIRRIAKYYPGAKPVELSRPGVAPVPSPVGLDIPQMLCMTDMIPETCDVRLDFVRRDVPFVLDKLCFKHDSFGDKLYPFLNRHFRKVVGMAPFTKLDYEKIDRERPNVLLNVLAERYLYMALNDDYHLKDARFEAAP